MEDLFTRKELDDLVNTADNACLSLFMPAVQAGSEVRQNPTRFKNLVSRTERLLSERNDLSPPADFLAPLNRLIHDTMFWANQSRGLAIFRSSRMFRSYRVPYEFREIVALAPHFHIKPMISFLRQEQRFYVLALSKKDVRLVECSLQKATELEVPSLPKGMDEALGYDVFQNRLQFRTGVSRTGDKAAATFHPHGTGPEKPKDDLLKYFQVVNRSIEQVLREDKAPLIVASVDYLFPIYAEANTYPHLLDEGIVGNPEGLPPEELKRQAGPIIERLLREKEQKVFSAYEEKAGRMPFSTDVGEVVSSAFHGRMDSLILSKEDELWGVFDAVKDQSLFSGQGERDAGSYDLLNFAAIHTLSNGGTVIPAPRALIPGRALVAAIFRY